MRKIGCYAALIIFVTHRRYYFVSTLILKIGMFDTNFWLSVWTQIWQLSHRNSLHRAGANPPYKKNFINNC